MVGSASCGKSKIGTYVANVLGTSNKPIINYRADDNLALSNWMMSGSDVMVFDDFSFTSVVNRTEPSKIFTQLKAWTSGISIQIRTRLNTNQNQENAGVVVKCVFISVNEIKKESSDIIESMPEFVDRIEVLPFNSEHSYAKPSYERKYQDSAKVADRCMTAFIKEYLELRGDTYNFNEWRKQVMEGQIEAMAGNNIQLAILQMIKDHPNLWTDNYPYERGFYNDTIIRKMQFVLRQQKEKELHEVFRSRDDMDYNKFN